MKVDIYMPWFIGDYLKDTADLTAEEHGAYLLLLAHMWNRGGRLPSDQTRLPRLAATDADRWPSVWATISRFFEEEEGEITQGRLVTELAKAMGLRAAASEGGKRSAEARRLKNGSAQPPKPVRTDYRSDVEESFEPPSEDGSRTGSEPPPNSSPSPPPSNRESGTPPPAPARSLEHRGMRLRIPVTAEGLTAAYGLVRSKVFPTTLPWVTPRSSWQTLDPIVAALTDDESACSDVLSTMFRFLEDLRDGKVGKISDRATKDPTYGFACWVARFTATREEIRGAAPRVAQDARGSPDRSLGYAKVTGATDYTDGMELFRGGAAK